MVEVGYIVPRLFSGWAEKAINYANYLDVRVTVLLVDGLGVTLRGFINM